MSSATSPTKFRRCSSVALSPTSSGANNPLRSSLGRRWSFDSTREGYVKDLKKYQSSNSRDESYPLMLSEKQKTSKKKKSSSKGSSSEPPSTASPSSSRRRCTYGRGHSMDVSSFAVPEDFELTQSSFSVFTPSSSSLESPSAQRSIEDHRPLLSSLRQRSSSLPRILPPIFDDETSHGGNAHHHRKSIAGALLSTSNTISMASTNVNSSPLYAPSSILVREMQKFVCRQAHDVSSLLPLPLPTKYSLIIKEEDEDLENASEFLSWEQAGFALLNLAKVHAASLAMRQIASQLFEDAMKTLDESKEHHHHHAFHHHIHSSGSSSSHIELSSAKERAQDIRNRISDSPFCDSSLRSRALALLSSSPEDSRSPTYSSAQGLCLNEDLNVKAISFRYSLEGEPAEIVSIKFERMTASTVGPILGDLCTFLYNCLDPEALQRGSLDVRELLAHYHSGLESSLSLLKVSVGDGHFGGFLECFKRHLAPGFFIAFLLTTKRCGLHDRNEAKVKMEVFVEELRRSL